MTINITHELSFVYITDVGSLECVTLDDVSIDVDSLEDLGVNIDQNKFLHSCAFVIQAFSLNQQILVVEDYSKCTISTTDVSGSVTHLSDFDRLGSSMNNLASVKIDTPFLNITLPESRFVFIPTRVFRLAPTDPGTLDLWLTRAVSEYMGVYVPIITNRCVTKFCTDLVQNKYTCSANNFIFGFDNCSVSEWYTPFSARHTLLRVTVDPNNIPNTQSIQQVCEYLHNKLNQTIFVNSVMSQSMGGLNIELERQKMSQGIYGVDFTKSNIAQLCTSNFFIDTFLDYFIKTYIIDLKQINAIQVTLCIGNHNKSEYRTIQTVNF